MTSTSPRGAYADAGVDYDLLQPFKDRMVEMGKRTLTFPNRHGVFVDETVVHAHGAVFSYRGDQRHSWCNTTEGLGNKNWIAEWMYQFSGLGRSFYEGIGTDVFLMAANDNIAQGARPVIYTDEIAAGDSDWFGDMLRSQDFIDGLYRCLAEHDVALPAGETPALKYLVNAAPPVISAPSLSGTVTGIILPRSQLITGTGLAAGDHIIGLPSSGLHANGVSLVIAEALKLPDSFMTRLPNGNTLGEEALIPTLSYMKPVMAMLDTGMEVHAFLPGTGDGVAKLAFDKRPFTYRVHSWLPEDQIPQLFRFMRELGISLEDCLTTFNWGMGYYAFVPAHAVERALTAIAATGHTGMDLGTVEEGERCVIFEPEGVTLAPPGD